VIEKHKNKESEKINSL